MVVVVVVVVVASEAVLTTTTCCLTKTCMRYTMLTNKTDKHLNDVYNLSSYIAENTLRLHLKDKLINAV